MIHLFSHAREPVNSLTHFAGAVLSVLGTILLAAACLQSVDPVRSATGGMVFGLSLVALYSASALYHYANCSARALVRLRKLDHAMIYVLIAGTYTPIFLGFLQGRTGWLLTLAIWCVALAGIVIKVAFINAPRWLSTALYLMMGWSIVLNPSIFALMPKGCIALIAGGGVSYTAGAVIYGLQKPNIFKKLGFHELFHLFVLLGSLLHFLAVYLYIV